VPPTFTKTPSPTRTTTLTRTPTRTATSTPTRTETRTPTATIPRPFGPEITFFGIAQADNVVRTPNGTTDDGVPLYDWPTQAGFIVVVEGRPGTSNRQINLTCGIMGLPECSGRAPVQIIADRALGNGSSAVCDTTPPNIGGVPAVPDLVFGSDQSTTNAINDFACRFDTHPQTTVACTFDELGNFSYVDSRTTAQFCSVPALGQELALKPGITRFKAQLADVSGNIGSMSEIAIRVP
jgi:hypothetical protein